MSLNSLASVEDHLRSELDRIRSEIETMTAEIAERQASIERLLAALTALTQGSDVTDATSNKSIASPKKRVLKKKRSSARPLLSDVQKWFAARNNEWASAAAIAEGVGRSHVSIRQLVYINSPDDFESRTEPGKERAKEFRLKT